MSTYIDIFTFSTLAHLVYNGTINSIISPGPYLSFIVSVITQSVSKKGKAGRGLIRKGQKVQQDKASKLVDHHFHSLFPQDMHINENAITNNLMKAYIYFL